MPATLITIRFSHFCEKARWALDHAGVRYDESAYIPGAHQLATRIHGGRSVPMLVTPHGVLRDSTKIVEFADKRAASERRLYPDDDARRAEVDAFIADLDDKLGPATRLLAYHHMLPVPDVLVKRVGLGMSRGERLRFRMALPLLRGPMRRMMRIDDERAARAITRIRSTFDDVSKRLGTSQSRGRYLFGDRLGAADITFAALASPALLPPSHPHYASELEGIPAPLLPLIEEIRATPAGRWACALYRDERVTR